MRDQRAGKFSQEAYGFTLTEVLVVIAIVILLVSLGAFVWQRAVRVGNQTACASQLRNLGIAIGTYQIDNAGQFPPANAGFYPYLSWNSYWFKPIIRGGSKSGGGLSDYIEGYASLQQNAVCPENRESMVRGIEDAYPVNPGAIPDVGYPYTVNYNLIPTTRSVPGGGSGAPLLPRLADLPDPSKTIVMMDANPAAWGHGFFHKKSGWTRVGFIHSGGANVLWADFRVSYVKDEEVIDTSEQDSNIRVTGIVRF